MNKKNEKQAMILRKGSTPEQIKAYFAQVLTLKNSGEEFPVDLDHVWPLIYGRKQEAVRALQYTKNKNGDFLYMQNIDYQLLRTNAQFKKRDGRGERKPDLIKLSVPCLEFFVARQVREVFEVYRQVFHQAVAATMEVLGRQYIGRAEYCNRFDKSMHSFNGLIPHYKMEFCYVNGMWLISTALCQAIELRTKGDKIKKQLRQKSNQLEMSFDDNLKIGGKAK